MKFHAWCCFKNNVPLRHTLAETQAVSVGLAAWKNVDYETAKAYCKKHRITCERVTVARRDLNAEKSAHRKEPEAMR